MNKFYTIIMSLVTGLLLFSSCTNDNNKLVDETTRQEVKVFAHVNLRVSDSSWDAGDKIGIYAFEANKELSDESLYEAKSNIPYVTNAGNGVFTNVDVNIWLPKEGAVDFIAYYPYTEELEDVYTLPINAADQSDLSKIDVLYSNNAKGLTSKNNRATLDFFHKLAKINFQIVSNGYELSEAKLALNSVLVDGSMNLKTGEVTTGSTEGNPEVALTDGINLVDYMGAMILPAQQFAAKTLTLTANGKEYTSALPAFQTKAGYEYLIKINYTVVGGQAELRVETSTIGDWNEGESIDEIVEIEDKPEITIVEVTEVTFSEESVALNIGETYEVKVAINPEDATDKTLIWTSSDATVASVKNGLVTALKEGTTMIKAVSKNGTAQDELSVTVNPDVEAVTEVSLDTNVKLLNVGQTYTFKVIVLPADAADKSITWASSDESIAKVVNGTVTALKVGTATITATSADGRVKDEATVTVSDNVVPVLPGEEL